MRWSWTFHVNLMIMKMMMMMDLIEISLLNLIQMLIEWSSMFICVIIVVTFKRQFRNWPELTRRLCGNWRCFNSTLQLCNSMNFMDVILAARFMFVRLEKKKKNFFTCFSQEINSMGYRRRYFMSSCFNSCEEFFQTFFAFSKVTSRHLKQLNERNKNRNLFNDIIFKSFRRDQIADVYIETIRRHFRCLKKNWGLR